MGQKKSFGEYRRDYGHLALSSDMLESSPFAQFQKWFEQIQTTELLDPTAMALATIDRSGLPNIRIVLMKGIHEQSFIFYTNYNSQKGEELKFNPQAAANFYWGNVARQVRIRGEVKPISAEMSDAYFTSRPIASQISAIASKQSKVITSREELASAVIAVASQGDIKRPQYWGGYALTPKEVEFWQGKDDRLHDRFRYKLLESGHWLIERLAP